MYFWDSEFPFRRLDKKDQQRIRRFEEAEKRGQRDNKRALRP